MAMIEVKRTDLVRKAKRGSGLADEKYYKNEYFYGGKRIAFYLSNHDVLYCKTDLIGHDFTKTVYERALSCRIASAYEYLFDMLGIDSKSKLSEFMDA